MRAVSRVDEAGLYVEDVLLEDEQPVPEGHVDQRPPDGFHAPMWTGTAWVEGKPESEILEALKAAKVAEMGDAAVDDLAGHFTPGKGRDETALLVASHVLKVCQALKITPDPRLVEVVGTGQKALQKKAEVEAAATVSELEEVSWT